MDGLILSQEAIFRLQQLSTQYYYHTGRRHKLANKEEVMELLHFSGMINHQNVHNAYNAFLTRLSKPQLTAFEKKGVKLRAAS